MKYYCRHHFLTIITALLCFAFNVHAADNSFLQVMNENRVSLGMEISKHDIDTIEYDDMVRKESSLERRFLVASFGINEITDLSLRYGQMAWDLLPRGAGIFDFGPAWGIGADVKIAEIEYPNLIVTCVAQYNHGTPDDNHASVGFESDIQEWLLGLQCAYVMDNIRLSGGINHSQVDFKYYDNGQFGKRQGGYESDNSFGLSAGCEWYIVPEFSLATTLRAIDQQGISLKLAYHF